MKFQLICKLLLLAGAGFKSKINQVQIKKSIVLAWQLSTLCLWIHRSSDFASHLYQNNQSYQKGYDKLEYYVKNMYWLLVSRYIWKLNLFPLHLKICIERISIILRVCLFVVCSQLWWVFCQTIVWKQRSLPLGWYLLSISEVSWWKLSPWLSFISPQLLVMKTIWKNDYF